MKCNVYCYRCLHKQQVVDSHKEKLKNDLTLKHGRERICVLFLQSEFTHGSSSCCCLEHLAPEQPHRSSSMLTSLAKVTLKVVLEGGGESPSTVHSLPAGPSIQWLSTNRLAFLIVVLKEKCITPRRL